MARGKLRRRATCWGPGRERISPTKHELGRLGSRETPSSSKSESGCEATFWRHSSMSWEHGTEPRLGGEEKELLKRKKPSGASMSVCVDLLSMITALSQADS